MAEPSMCVSCGQYLGEPPQRFYTGDRVMPKSSSFVYRIAKCLPNDWYELDDGSGWHAHQLDRIADSAGESRG